MKAEIHYLHSPDVEDLQSYQPEEQNKFGVLVQAMLRPVGEDGEESFDFLVCTPSWFEEHQIKGQYAFGYHFLFFSFYDYALLYQSIENLCNRNIGDNWGEIAKKIGRYGHWEFQDYRPEI